MFTIKDNNNTELIIKNSKFICYLYKINSKEDINNIFEDIKNKYNDANHHCYAYIINNEKKSSDDGEPQGTAGIPILKVLDNYNLTNILVIVIRYFGGIKLGANGLIRAYTKSVSNTIKENTIVELQKGYNINITFPYSRLKEIDYLLKNIKINNKTFDNIITYNLNIPEYYLNIIINYHIDYTIIKNIYIEKEITS